MSAFGGKADMPPTLLAAGLTLCLIAPGAETADSIETAGPLLKSGKYPASSGERFF